MSKDKNNKINGSTKICDLEIVKKYKNISEDFIKIFKEKEKIKNKIKILKRIIYLEILFLILVK